MVAEPGQMVVGVGFEGELPELVSPAAMAFPPIYEGYGGQDWDGVSGAAAYEALGSSC